MPANTFYWKNLILEGLREDLISSDFTSHAANKVLSPDYEGSKVKAQIIAKDQGIFCGTAAFDALKSIAFDHSIQIEISQAVNDGDRLKAGDLCANLTSSALVLHQYERTILNLISFASGMASSTDRSVQKLMSAFSKDGSHNGTKIHCPRVVHTRKFLPYYRELMIEAVICGGGSPHRSSLASGVLFKENHLKTIQTDTGFFETLFVNAVHICPHGMKPEIEVTSIDQLTKAANAGFRVFLLDHFTPDQIREAIQLKTAKYKGELCLEASGGISESNIQNYAIPGLDVISLGSLTHSVKAFDFTWLIQ